MSQSGFDKYSWAILGSAVLWGCFWIPLRVVDELGGGSFILLGAGFLIPLFVLLPICLKHCLQIRSWSPTVWLMAIMFCIAGCFYTEGALRGNVARVILLFYLTPVWSTLLARVFLSEKITRRRMLTLFLGLSGMYVILGMENALPLPQNLSEWFGLLAGIAWGIAMVCLQKSQHMPIRELALAIFFLYAPVLALLTLVPGGRHWQFDAEMLTVYALIWVLALALVWNLPGVLLTIFGAVIVEPGKVAILLMLEVVVGIVTANLLTDEPFGIVEGIGAVLIISAGVAEFIPLPRWIEDRRIKH